VVQTRNLDDAVRYRVLPTGNPGETIVEVAHQYVGGYMSDSEAWAKR
jgi:hypothetical protein